MRGARLLFAGAVGLLGCPCVAQAGVTFTLRYDFVDMEVSPNIETHRLASKSVYTITRDSVLVITDANNVRHEIRLGAKDSFSGQAYEDGVLSARVRQKALTLNFRYPGRFVRVVITPTGGYSCKASISYSPAPGHKYFEVFRRTNNEKILESDEHVENLTCSAAENDL